jgi:hypothetical protein
MSLYKAIKSAKGWRKAVMFVPLSQDALAAMVQLATGINNEQYAKERKPTSS